MYCFNWGCSNCPSLALIFKFHLYLYFFVTAEASIFNILNRCKGWNPSPSSAHIFKTHLVIFSYGLRPLPILSSFFKLLVYVRADKHYLLLVTVLYPPLSHIFKLKCFTYGLKELLSRQTVSLYLLICLLYIWPYYKSAELVPSNHMLNKYK